MHNILYHISLRFYYFIVFIFSPFYPKAKQFIRGRYNWKEKLKELDFKNHPWIWIHFSSYGEYQDGKFFAKKFKQEYQSAKFIFTFHSPSGYELVKNSAIADYICYLPMDYQKNARHFIHEVNPICAVFCRNDIWYNYLKYAKKKNIPTIHLSTLIDANSNFLKSPQIWHYKKAFELFDLFLVQTEETKHILNNMFHSNNVHVIGNTRVDSIFKRLEKNNCYPAIEKFINHEFCIIGGSLLQRDFEIFVKTYQTHKTERIKWIIVPHEITNQSLQLLSTIPKDKAILYSQIHKLNDTHQVLMIDCVGILMDLYKYANVSYIGGGFNKIGIHNIMEACVYGNKILIGPNHRNYLEALNLIDLNVCQQIKNEEELSEKLNILFTNQHELINEKKKAIDYASSKQGATLLAIAEIKKLMLRKNSFE